MSALQPVTTDRRIGRFRLLRPLGQGAEGVVYLAADPELSREVAIKTLTLGTAPDPARIEQLLGAARTAGALSHPNIVPVYEAGIEAGHPYVVFEYVEGTTLARQLASGGPMPMAEAVIMMSQILAGAAQLHARQFIHGDIKPANILVGTNGVPRLSDFGLARIARAGTADATASGTVRYMAPEYFDGRPVDCRADVFALGLVFHEMLTGETVFGKGSAHAQIYRVVHEAAPAPSTRNARIAPEIDAIVLKALHKDPAQRFTDAADMRRALDRVRVAPAAADRVVVREQAVHGTVEFLVRRMAHKSDFPALSASFSRINRISSQADDSSIRSLSDMVMRDFALTQKLLRLVNAAAVGAGKVTKVSQAITILGVGQLRAVATAMMLAGGGHSVKSPQIGAALTDAFVAGVIARNVGRMTGLAAVEELFICGMFSPLGELLALYYLADEHGEIARRIAEDGIEPDAASRAVLGLTYDELGSAVAQHWQFPPEIVSALAPLPPQAPSAARSTADRLWHCAGYARELCALSRKTDPAARESALQAHIERFAGTIAIDPAKVRELMMHSVDIARKYVAAAGLPVSNTPMLEGMRALCGGAAPNEVTPSPRTEPPAVKAAAVAPSAAAPAPQRAPVPKSPTPIATDCGWSARLRLAWRSLF